METWQDRMKTRFMITFKYNEGAVIQYKITARNFANAHYQANQIAIALDLPNHLQDIEKLKGEMENENRI